jgi:hypothetical protein
MGFWLHASRKRGERRQALANGRSGQGAGKTSSAQRGKLGQSAERVAASNPPQSIPEAAMRSNLVIPCPG